MTTISSTSNAVRTYRGRVLHFLYDPQYRERDAYEYWEGGLLVVLGGRVIKAGDYAAPREDLPAGAQLHDYGGKLIVPGFIDTHIHFPQTDIIASPSPGLLHWLETYTFPGERRFESEQYAAGVASFFLDELLRNGMTSAMVWSTVHHGSAETPFTQAQQRGMRMITGKVMMDRNCPKYLRDTAESGTRDTADLISRWHGKDHLTYAITPRFASTSSEAQLQACAELAKQYKDVFIQTHVAENPDKAKWVADLFLDARSYLDAYDRYELLRKGAFYGYAIWLDDGDCQRMAESGAAVAHCPTSNLFLGSGLYNFHQNDTYRLALTLTTDVGGGSSLSMLRTMGTARKVVRMGGYHLTALRIFYLATRGAAETLGWEDRIGSFVPGAEADFIVLDPTVIPLLARRNARSKTLEELLLSLALLGEDRAIAATYIQGEPAKFAIGANA